MARETGEPVNERTIVGKMHPVLKTTTTFKIPSTQLAMERVHFGRLGSRSLPQVV